MTPDVKKTTGSHSMWDAFEHILLFISLYVLVLSLSFMLHIFVNKWFPGSLSLNSQALTSLNSLDLVALRVLMASLIVSYPIFSILFLNITKRTNKHPEIRMLKSRKILIYFTLILTFIILISNVIMAIFNFLNGNTSLNFFLHFSITLIICTSVLSYYIYQIREDRKVHV